MIAEALESEIFRILSAGAKLKLRAGLCVQHLNVLFQVPDRGSGVLTELDYAVAVAQHGAPVGDDKDGLSVTFRYP